MNVPRKAAADLNLIFRSKLLVAKVLLFVLLLAAWESKVIAEEDAIVFTYEPRSGLVTWARNANQPAEEILILMIDGPKPLGFPKDSPRWNTVVYSDDHAEFYAFDPADIPANAGVEVSRGGKAQPLLVYSSGLTPPDFGTITYQTNDVFLHCVVPTWVKRSRTVETTIRFANARK